MTVVSNPSGDGDEVIERAARTLRSSLQNKEVFQVVYKGSKRFKSMDEIGASVSNFNTNTYKAVNRLFGENIVEKKTENGVLFYGKKDFYIHNRERILKLSENSQRLKEFPTKRKTKGNLVSKNIFVFRTRPKVEQLYVDDIGSFGAVKAVRKTETNVLRGMPERTINTAICRILNQSEKKDWGGERHDIYSNKMTLNGSRVSAAFALKGKAIKGILTPGKMGKNGDQVQRLFEAIADVYIVAYSGAIDDRIVDLMQTHAIQKSIANNKKIFFCVIDGDDMARLVVAYPAQFGIT